MKVARGGLINLREGWIDLLEGLIDLLEGLIGVFEGLIGLLERLVIFFGEVRGQDSNVLSVYRDEPDLYQ
jgi:hypothetical protein